MLNISNVFYVLDLTNVDYCYILVLLDNVRYYLCSLMLNIGNFHKC